MFCGTDHEEEGFQRMGAYQYGSIVRTEDADDRSAFTVYLSINAAHVSLYDASIGKAETDLPFGGDPEPFKDSTGDGRKSRARVDQGIQGLEWPTGWSN